MTAIDEIADERISGECGRQRLQLSDHAQNGTALHHFGIMLGPAHPDLNGLTEQVAHRRACSGNVAQKILKPFGFAPSEYPGDFYVYGNLALGKLIPIGEVLALHRIVERAGPKKSQEHGCRPDAGRRPTGEDP